MSSFLRRYLVILGSFSFIFLLCGLFFLRFLTVGDSVALHFFASTHSIATLAFFGFFTGLGSWYGVLCVAGLVFFSIKNKKYSHFFALSLGSLLTLGVSFSFILKYLFVRARPQDMPALFIEHSYSFPSAHATLAIILYGFFWYFFSRASHVSRARAFLLASVIVLISFSRIYLGVHYVSDVVGGLLLGGAILGGYFFVVDKRRLS